MAPDLPIATNNDGKNNNPSPSIPNNSVAISSTTPREALSTRSATSGRMLSVIAESKDEPEERLVKPEEHLAKSSDAEDMAVRKASGEAGVAVEMVDLAVDGQGTSRMSPDECVSVDGLDVVEIVDVNMDVQQNAPTTKDATTQDDTIDARDSSMQTSQAPTPLNIIVSPSATSLPSQEPGISQTNDENSRIRTPGADSASEIMVSQPRIPLPAPPCHIFVCEYKAGELFVTEPFPQNLLSANNFYKSHDRTSRTNSHTVVIALEPVTVLSLPLAHLSSTLSPHPKLRLALSLPLQSLSASHMSLSLATIPFFSDLPPHKLSLLARLFTVRKIPSNKVLFREGQRSTGLYYLASGRCEATAEGVDKNPIFLYTITAGQWFGETALVGIDVNGSGRQPGVTDDVLRSPLVSDDDVDGQNREKMAASEKTKMDLNSRPLPRACTVTAISESVCLFLPRRRLRRFFAIAPELLANPENERFVLPDDQFHPHDPRLKVGAVPKLSRARSNTAPAMSSTSLSTIGTTSPLATKPTGLPATALTISHDDDIDQFDQEMWSPVSKTSTLNSGSGFSTGFSSLLAFRGGSILKTIPLFSSLQHKTVGPLAIYDEHRLTQLADMMQWVHMNVGQRCVVRKSARSVGDHGENNSELGTPRDNDTKSTKGRKKRRDRNLDNTRDANTKDQMTFSPSFFIVVRGNAKVTGPSCYIVNKDPKNDDNNEQTVANALVHPIPSNSVVDADTDDLSRLFDTVNVTVEKKRGEYVGEWFLVNPNSLPSLNTAVIADDTTPDTATSASKSTSIISDDSALTIEATTDLLLLRLPSSSFAQFIKICPEVGASLREHVAQRTMKQTLNVLRSSNLVKDYVYENRAWSKMDGLSSLFNVLFVRKGEVVCRQGSLDMMIGGHVRDKEKKREQTVNGCVYIIVRGNIDLTLSVVDSSNNLTTNTDSTVLENAATEPMLTPRRKPKPSRAVVLGASPSGNTSTTCGNTSANVSPASTAASRDAAGDAGSDAGSSVELKDIAGTVAVSSTSASASLAATASASTVTHKSQVLVECLSTDAVFGCVATAPLTTATATTDTVLLCLPSALFNPLSQICIELWCEIMSQLRRRDIAVCLQMPLFKDVNVKENRAWAKRDLAASLWESRQIQAGDTILRGESFQNSDRIPDDDEAIVFVVSGSVRVQRRSGQGYSSGFGYGYGEDKYKDSVMARVCTCSVEADSDDDDDAPAHKTSTNASSISTVSERAVKSTNPPAEVPCALATSRCIGACSGWNQYMLSLSNDLRNQLDNGVVYERVIDQPVLLGEERALTALARFLQANVPSTGVVKSDGAGVGEGEHVPSVAQMRPSLFINNQRPSIVQMYKHRNLIPIVNSASNPTEAIPSDNVKSVAVSSNGPADDSADAQNAADTAGLLAPSPSFSSVSVTCDTTLLLPYTVTAVTPCTCLLLRGSKALMRMLNTAPELTEVLLRSVEMKMGVIIVDDASTTAHLSKDEESISVLVKGMIDPHYCDIAALRRVVGGSDGKGALAGRGFLGRAKGRERDDNRATTNNNNGAATAAAEAGPEQTGNAGSGRRIVITNPYTNYTFVSGRWSCRNRNILIAISIVDETWRSHAFVWYVLGLGLRIAAHC